MKKKDWSEQDKRVNKLTGFEPADREKRECISCGKSGHYYYECNDGQFLKAADLLVEVLKATQSLSVRSDWDKNK